MGLEFRVGVMACIGFRAQSLMGEVHGIILGPVTYDSVGVILRVGMAALRDIPGYPEDMYVRPTMQS